MFDNTYFRLPSLFYSRVMPAKVREAKLVQFNQALADSLGFKIENIDPVLLFAGQTIPAGVEPFAQAYAGHQFGGFTILGDGRAIVLGEHVTPSGQRFDIQFKGSGHTPYSRGGDGLAALGPMLREFLISEAMHALGIPTTRSLAVVTTGEPVYRQPVQRGAILTRVAASHLRVGTFEFAAVRGTVDDLKRLADYAIARHDPTLAGHPSKYVEFLRNVMTRQAQLIAQWQLVGFVHGVMNTDNMTISGETIDYGPCAFMDTYHADTVFSSIDRGGRYAYGQQPNIGQWNLARLAESLLPLIDADQERAVDIATDLLNEYPKLFTGFWLDGLRKKLGLQAHDDADRELVVDLLTIMQNEKVDYTLFFRGLSEGREPTGQVWLPWLTRWHARVISENRTIDQARTSMRAVNPAVIPRNDRVEAALSAAADRDDFGPFQELLDVVRSPFDLPEKHKAYADPPPESFKNYRTFCGT